MIPPSAHAVLAQAARAAVAASDAAHREHGRTELAEKTGIGADGTPTTRLDLLVDTAVAEVAQAHRINLLSEEIGVDLSRRCSGVAAATPHLASQIAEAISHSVHTIPAAEGS